MLLETMFKSIHLRPRILHRLPGRLRIHIPVLRQISDQFQKIATLLLKDFSFPEGIHSVGINFITGNLLIEYDVNHSDEKKIMRWLADITKIAESIWARFSLEKNGKIEKISGNLLEFFKQKANNKEVLDKNIQIPDYVWN